MREAFLVVAGFALGVATGVWAVIHTRAGEPRSAGIPLTRWRPRIAISPSPAQVRRIRKVGGA